MRTKSNRQLAKALGVSEAAVRKAAAAGRIQRGADGQWDTAQVQSAWREHTDAAQQRDTPQRDTPQRDRPPPDAPPRDPPPPKLKPVPEAAVGAVRDTLKEQGLPSGSGGMTFLQARTANEVLKAQERKLRLQRLKGELVDRSRAVTLVFRLAREERDAWANWPARVAALLAAELGVSPHQAQAALDRHVRQHLAELGEVRVELR